MISANPLGEFRRGASLIQHLSRRRGTSC